MYCRLVAGLICLATSAVGQASLEEAGRWTMTAEVKRVGGFSGLELDADGVRGLVITDRGLLLNMLVARDRSGRLEDVNLTFANRQLPEPVDSEGLALSDDGRLYIAIEGLPARVVELGAPLDVRPHPTFRRMRKNGGPEAMAVRRNGDLILFPERPSRPSENPDQAEQRKDLEHHAMFVFSQTDGWQVHYTLPYDPPFLPVGADIGPDGQLYLLERAASLLGFRSQIRRFDPDDPNPERLLRTGPGDYDNLEGIAVSTDPQGRTRLTLVSDDNFLSVQRTEVVEFLVIEPLAQSAPQD